MKMFNVFVTGTGSLIGQAIIKSIRNSSLKDSISIVGCDYFNNTVGGFWCDKNYILPDILKANNEELWENKIFEVIEKEKISLLFIGVDFELLRFANLKEKIEASTQCKVIVSSKEVLEIGNDKFLTAEFLKSHGLNYPKTYLMEENSVFSIDYPCIVKPKVGARSKGVYVARSKQEMFEKAKLISDPIAQELIGNGKTEYTCGVLFLDGELVNSIALRRDLKEGNTHLAEYKKDFNPSIYKYLKDIAYYLKPFGSCNLQLRLDEQNKPYLFEINPRFSGTTYIRSLFGYNEVEYIIRHFLNLDNPDFVLREGKVIRFYDEKLV